MLIFGLLPLLNDANKMALTPFMVCLIFNKSLHILDNPWHLSALWMSMTVHKRLAFGMTLWIVALPSTITSLWRMPI
jgi:hypothetical protein